MEVQGFRGSGFKVQGVSILDFGFRISDFGFIDSLRSIRFNNGSGFKAQRFWVQPSRRPNQQPVKSKKETLPNRQSIT
ncbi:hypothetical protein D1AOALGA4SA_3050 [Olavius algarvensis Delta 1 endosymbiont]|nr:hypothetical protein D1AOALGA4SA_3050 [Olavius algarvensis Delta 1 endosymbiont]